MSLSASTCTHGEVRLFGGYTDHDGVAEVCINGYWADICQDISDRSTVARSFCRQFTGQEPSIINIMSIYESYNINVLSTVFFYSSCCRGQRNTGNVTLYDVSCSGLSRPFVQDCLYSIVSGYSSSSCSLQEEFFVGCYPRSSCTTGDVQLRGGNSSLEGRVEFCSQGIWGAITTFSWSPSDAMVVCRELGYPWECEQIIL